jgi:hypothetical protein
VIWNSFHWFRMCFIGMEYSSTFQGRWELSGRVFAVDTLISGAR